MAELWDRIWPEFQICAHTIDSLLTTSCFSNQFKREMLTPSHPIRIKHWEQNRLIRLSFFQAGPVA